MMVMKGVSALHCLPSTFMPRLKIDELVENIDILDLFASIDDVYQPEAKDRRTAQEISLEWSEHSAISFIGCVSDDCSVVYHGDCP